MSETLSFSHKSFCLKALSGTSWRSGDWDLAFQCRGFGRGAEILHVSWPKNQNRSNNVTGSIKTLKMVRIENIKKKKEKHFLCSPPWTETKSNHGYRWISGQYLLMPVPLSHPFIHSFICPYVVADFQVVPGNLLAAQLQAWINHLLASCLTLSCARLSSWTTTKWGNYFLCAATLWIMIFESWRKKLDYEGVPTEEGNLWKTEAK